MVTRMAHTEGITTTAGGVVVAYACRQLDGYTDRCRGRHQQERSSTCYRAGSTRFLAGTLPALPQSLALPTLNAGRGAE